jgi:hypothetical protein
MGSLATPSGDILYDARVDAPEEPALGESQVAIDGGLGYLHQDGGFLGRATQKVAQFDQLDFVGIELDQFVQCPVQVQHFRAVNVDPQKVVVERDAVEATTPPLGLGFARMVNQDHAHHFGGEGVEMPAVVPCGLFLVQEPEVKLVDQRRGLKNVRVALPTDVGGGYLPKVRIDERHQIFKG